MTAWALTISEFAFIKSSLEFENFYANRFQSYQPVEAQSQIVQRQQHWTQTHKISANIFDAFADPSEQKSNQAMIEEQDGRQVLYHQRKMLISPFLKALTPNQHCPNNKSNKNQFSICAKSIAERNQP